MPAPGERIPGGNRRPSPGPGLPEQLEGALDDSQQSGRGGRGQRRRCGAKMTVSNLSITDSTSASRR